MQAPCRPQDWPPCERQGPGAEGERRTDSVLSDHSLLGSLPVSVPLSFSGYRTQNPKDNECRQGGAINHL